MAASNLEVDICTSDGYCKKYDLRKNKDTHEVLDALSTDGFVVLKTATDTDINSCYSEQQLAENKV